MSAAALAVAALVGWAATAPAAGKPAAGKPAAGEPAAGAISGHLTDSDGRPIAGAEVSVVDSVTGFGGAVVKTDRSGRYLAGGLTAGDYSVCFDTGRLDPSWPAGGYVPQCNGDQPLTNQGGVPVPVFRGGARTVDATLVEGVGLQGTISGAGEGGLANVGVALFDPATGAQVGGGGTDASGHYLVNQLPAGRYQVCFEPGVFQPDYAQQCYPNQSGRPGATALTLVPGPLRKVDAALRGRSVR
jgi:hypothetical protein